MNEANKSLKSVELLAENRAKYEAGNVDGTWALICDCYCRDKGMLRVDRKIGQVGECFACSQASDGRPSIGVMGERFCIGRLHPKNGSAVRSAIENGMICKVKIMKTSDVRRADDRGRDLAVVIVDEKAK